MRWSWIKHLFADGAYDRRKLMEKAAFEDFVIKIVRHIDTESGFKVWPAAGRRAHRRLDDPLATARVRLRATHPRLPSADKLADRSGLHLPHHVAAVKLYPAIDSAFHSCALM
jgi:hypothetical protein